MIAMIATFRAVPGKEKEFETGYSGLMASVRANEPGTRLYQLCRSKAEAGVYKVMEIFDSQDALDAHMKSAWVKAAWPGIGPYVDGTPVMEMLDPIA